MPQVARHEPSGASFPPGAEVDVDASEPLFALVFFAAILFGGITVRVHWWQYLPRAEIFWIFCAEDTSYCWHVHGEILAGLLEIKFGPAI